LAIREDGEEKDEYDDGRFQYSESGARFSLVYSAAEEGGYYEERTAPPACHARPSDGEAYGESYEFDGKPHSSSF
jgi:hypothetical protein